MTANLLARVEVALNDWLHCYAPEECQPGHVAATRKRLIEEGGTLAYIADLLRDVREARTAAQGPDLPVKDASKPSGRTTPASAVLSEVERIEAMMVKARSALGGDLKAFLEALWAQEELDGALNDAFPALAAAVRQGERMRYALVDACELMDRARRILTDSNPRPECNWGMLNTTALRQALAGKEGKP